MRDGGGGEDGLIRLGLYTYYSRVGPRVFLAPCYYFVARHCTGYSCRVHKSSENKRIFTAVYLTTVFATKNGCLREAILRVIRDDGGTCRTNDH